ncbi:MAG: hypothetical protein R2709_08645 [Marmoricola sp.]
MSEWKAIEPTDLNPTLLGKVFMVRSRGEAGSSGIVGTLAWYGESEAEGVRIGLHGSTRSCCISANTRGDHRSICTRQIPAPIIRQRTHADTSAN